VSEIFHEVLQSLWKSLRLPQVGKLKRESSTPGMFCLLNLVDAFLLSKLETKKAHEEQSGCRGTSLPIDEMQSEFVQHVKQR